jgi:hypothetical protein
MEASQREPSAEAEASRQTGHQFSTYQGDPLAVLLHDRLSLSAVPLGILALVGSGLVMGISVAAYALAFPEGTLQDFVTWLSDNWMQAVIWGLVAPLIVGFYGWINKSTSELFSVLFRDGVFASSDAEFEAVLTKGAKSPERVYNHPAWAIAATGVTLAYTALSLAVQVWTKPWGDLNRSEITCGRMYLPANHWARWQPKWCA